MSATVSSFSGRGSASAAAVSVPVSEAKALAGLSMAFMSRTLSSRLGGSLRMSWPQASRHA